MDLAPRDGINILDHAKLHAMIACTGLIGSPIPQSAPARRCPGAETASSSGVISDASEPTTHAGAAAPVLIDLGACLTMGEGR